MKRKTNLSLWDKKNVKNAFLKVLFIFVSLGLSSSSLFAQTKSITGLVTDESNEPLIGVSVVVQGTLSGTITNFDGEYSIQAKPGDNLVFSYVGMESITVKVEQQSIINVILKDDVELLGEVIVIGYGSAKKRDLTGTITSVNASEIADRPSVNPIASLQGKVAGVQVVNTGRAGQDPEIRIRGTNSINGYAPIYIVDGMMIDNINYLNPADIETMEILKDPSSLAIFGVKGSNGVIIITTKKAKTGQSIINFNSSVGFKSITDKVKLTNAAQFKDLYNEQRLNQGVDPFDYTLWNANTNWQDEIFQTGLITNNNLSITGTTDKSNFYLGVGYTTEEGSIKSEKFSRLTVTANSDYRVKDWLRFGFQINGARSLPADAKDVGGALKAAPIAPKYGKAENGETLIHTMPDFQRAQVWNPLINIETRGRHNRAVNNRLSGSVYGEVDMLKQLNFKITFSYDYSSNESRIYSPLIYMYNPSVKGGKENVNNRESVNQHKSTDAVAQSEYILNYNDTFGKHNINATAGVTTHYRDFSGLDGGRSQVLGSFDFSIPNNNPDKWWLSSLPNTAMTNGSNQHRRFTMSYLVRGLYNYDNRYLLNLSYRRDGSSVFRGVGNTWDNFYAVGAGWVVSDEQFFPQTNVIDFLKLKGSYGVLGSENTGGKNYPSYPELISSGSAVFGDQIIPGYTYAYLVQNLGWEKTHSWEVGLDLTMFDQRLRIEPVYYNKLTKDIIVQLDSRHGGSNSLENFGEIENRGFELAASWSDEIGSTGFRYDISANLTTINNKVKKLGRDDADAIFQGVSRTITGEPIGHFYGYKVEGVYQNNEDIKQSPVNTLGKVFPGDLKFKDLDGDGKITPDDRTRIGSPTPDYTYGFNVNMSYKGFDLGIDMMGIYGNEIYRKWDTSEYAQFNYHQDRINRWRGEGTSNWEPILDPSRAMNKQASNYFVEDASFFRIRNIQIGYTLPQSILNRIYMKSLRFYANVQNPKTWKKTSGYSPEIGGSALSSGIDNGSYPMPIVYTFGVNLTF